MTVLPTEWPRRLRLQRILIGLLLAFIFRLLCACGSSTRPVVGTIEFVDATGSQISAVTSLSTNGVINLVGTVTSDDELLGVSWTVDCGSMPPEGGTTTVISTACGTFTPAQTLSGPIPTYPSTGYITAYTAPSTIPKGSTVTITAHATSLPSATSSVTVTIVSSP